MDEFLQPLVDLRPSALNKLQAAWDGLSTESQMEVLAAINQRNGVLPNEVARKALASPNAYIRYLAAERLRYTSRENDSDLLDAIRRDPDPLVQSAQLRLGLGEPYKDDFPPKFWALPGPSRFRCLTTAALGPLDAHGVVRLIEYALEVGSISPEDISDALVEYVETLRSAPDKAPVAWEVYLWKFAARAPEYLWAYLVRRLPSGYIPHEEFLKADPRCIKELLYRTDLYWPLKQFRKAVRRSQDPRIGPDLKELAVEMERESRKRRKRHFWPSWGDFAFILLAGCFLFQWMGPREISIAAAVLSLAACLLLLLQIGVTEKRRTTQDTPQR